MQNKAWNIKNMPIETRRRIKAYGGANGLTIPEVIEKAMDSLETNSVKTEKIFKVSENQVGY